MFEQILKLLGEPAGSSRSGKNDPLQIAVAALLVQAAVMDDCFDPTERSVIERLLAARFDLDALSVRRLLHEAEHISEQSSQLYPFTRMAVERLGEAERVRLIEMLWEVAYADGTLDPDEDALLRRIAGLIYVSDRDRGAARKRVLARLGLKPT